jgi:hypothetical protein
LADVRVDRNASPDIEAGSKDPDAAHQRFVIHTRCSDACVIEFQSQDDETIQKKLAEFRNGPIGFALGQGHIHVDSTTVQSDPMFATQWIEKVSDGARKFVLMQYSYALVPILFLGSISFLIVSLLFWRRVLLNVSYVLALCSWALLAARTSVIVLIAATSFPVLNPIYLWPAQLFLISGALFSFAALRQLSGEHTQDSPTFLSRGDV